MHTRSYWFTVIVCNVGLLALGCGKSDKPVAVALEEAPPPMAQLPEKKQPIVPETPVVPEPEPAPKPFPSPLVIERPPMIPGEAGNLELAPMPRIAGAPVPIVPVVAQVPPVVDPKEKPEPKPVEKVEPKPIKPIEYPKKIDDKDVHAWLKDAVSNTDAQVRQASLGVIPQFGPDARKPSIEPLFKIVLTDPDPGVRMAALSLLSVLGYEDKKEEQRAISAIRAVMTNAPAGSLLKAYAIKAIAVFGPAAASQNTVNTLTTALIDPSWETRLTATTALGAIAMPMPTDPKAAKNPEKKEVKPPPMSSGSPVDPIQYDPKSPNPIALKAIIDTALKDPCASVRLEATQALLKAGPPVPANPLEYAKCVELYLKPIAKLVDEKDDKGRVNTLREKNPNVQVWLLLVQIMYNSEMMKDNVVKIAGYIKHTEKNVRLNALNALSMIGPQAAPAINEIMDALQYDEPAIVATAMQCIAALGKDGGAALPELEKIKAGSKDPKKPKDADKDWKPDESLRHLAKETIEYVTGKGKPVEEPKKDDKKEEKKDDKKEDKK